MVDIYAKRSIGGITVDVTISEDHVDEIEVTEHPVEQGASISDHEYKKPAMLTMVAGWSNSSEEADGDSSYIYDVYDQLRELQVSGDLLTVVTDKRTYYNMVIKSLSTTTDNETANVLMVTAILKEVIVVDTETVTIASNSSQSSVEDTGSVSSTGTKTASEVTNITTDDLE